MITILAITREVDDAINIFFFQNARLRRLLNQEGERQIDELIEGHRRQRGFFTLLWLLEHSL